MKKTIPVTFLPAGRTIEVEEGETLLKAARRGGIHINASCGGAGVCGKCKVTVKAGEVAGGLGRRLAPAELAAGKRQACCAFASGPATVELPREGDLAAGVLATAVPVHHRARQHLFRIEELKKEGVFLPPVEKFFLELPRATAKDNMADAARIILGLHNQYDLRGLTISLPVLRKIRRALREDDFRVTVTVAFPVNEAGKKYLINIQPGNWVHRKFGLAFDIGTTTVYGQLVDLNSGQVLAEGGDYNGQLGYGEDVISRMIHAEKPAGLDELQEAAASTINSIIRRLLKETAIEADEITSITIAGNTAMTHLFLGLEPHNIRRAPYVPVSTFLAPVRAADLDLILPRHTVAMIYPAISSYVGGDIVAGVMGSGMYRTDKLTLYVDIGTNAEIVIGSREWLVCAACSAGPAFEGGGITHGMRAAVGAIEDFDLDPQTLEPMILTVGNWPPVGICGSGLLVVIATLFEQGLIDHRGKFRRDLASDRVRPGRSGYEFVLAWRQESGGKEDIVLNEVDIENFIRAKGAIFAGVKTLVEEVGLAIGDIEQILLAGGFGSYIDLDAAMTVGLLPEVAPEKIIYVGNGSLMGARMSELSNHIRRDVVEVVHRMTSFELSEVASFKEQYVASLFLPHTDLELFPHHGTRMARRRPVPAPSS
ncbi:MAG: ASKHA domain-containing protein [Desulfobulbaceae bacterium]|nr:ASKHA domain-containing protein [Desulfobulbaceae bacterium]